MPQQADVNVGLSSGFFIGLGVGLSLIGVSTVAAAFSKGELNLSKLVSFKSGSSKAYKEYKPYRPPQPAEADATDYGCGTGSCANGDEKEERAPEREAFWFVENMSPFFSTKMSLRRVLFEGRSKFQFIQVIETAQFGKTLVMDGQTQSAEADEHHYHESLVHPALLMHPNPKKVFIGGGGEFATAREVLRHKSVEKCIMVDIDEVSCEMCKEQLPEWGQRSWEDPRFEVHYTDAKQWLEDTEMTFDVIIMDICDPIEAGPAYPLYTKDFYDFLKAKMNPGGLFITQSGPGAVFNVTSDCFTVINHTMNQSFNYVIPYTVSVPSFGCDWGFNIAFHDADTYNAAEDLLDKPCKVLDEMIAARIKGPMIFLDSISFKGLFGIAKSIRQECSEEARIMTLANPVFMYAK